MNDNYCPLIFHGIYIERSYKDIFLAPCCVSSKVKLSEDHINFTNNTHLNKLRSENKNNIKSKECKLCWDVEACGGVSKRQATIDQYKNNQIPINLDTILYSIDYNTLPICNAKCIICSPRYSSTWAAASGISLKNIITNNYDYLNGLEIDNLKTLYFNGGEPLLTDEHLVFLRRIKDISVVEIMYNTNGSCFPREEVLELWSKAKQITLAFSIDGIEESFEKTRTPLNWNTVANNIKKIYTIDYINVHCSFTIGRHNVYHLEETINWFKQLSKFDALSQFHVHYVNPGHALHLERATIEEKKQFKLELQKFKDYYWFDSIYNSFIDEI